VATDARSDHRGWRIDAHDDDWWLVESRLVHDTGNRYRVEEQARRVRRSPVWCLPRTPVSLPLRWELSLDDWREAHGEALPEVLTDLEERILSLRERERLK
jgi:hypothetical protein